MGVFLGALEYVLEEGNTNDWFNDNFIVAGAIASAIGAIIFFYRAFTVDFPVVDLKAFTNKNFAFGSMFSFVMGIGLYGLTYIYPLFLARIRGYDFRCRSARRCSFRVSPCSSRRRLPASWRAGSICAF